jgi:hypothetical protein
VRDSLRREIEPREPFADVAVELVCDRVRVERLLFGNSAGTVSPRRNRCRANTPSVERKPVRFRKFGKLLNVTEQFASQSGLR